MLRTFLAFLNSGDALLELVDVSPQETGLPAYIGGALVPGGQGAVLARGRDVESGGEGAVSGAGKDNSPHFRVGGELPEDVAHLEPHGFVEGVEFIGPVDLDVCHGGAG